MISGEQIAYTYDALNRLASAQTTQTGGTQWGQSYTYDGFGNLTDQTVIKGSAPDVHVAYNASNNLQTGDTADANGNIGSGYLYDIDNRLVQPVSSGSVAYGYDVANKRVWRGDTTSGLDEIAFWAGQKLATYQVSSDLSGIYFTLTSTNVYFGGKLISKGSSSTSWTDKVALAPVAADRLGSIKKFYPYGTERPSATANDTEKFTGYYRDASTGLDYADQRYHQPGVGRFMTADPYGGSAKASDPGSWNKYAYVGADPVNRKDPSVLDPEGDPFVGIIYFEDLFSGSECIIYDLYGPGQFCQGTLNLDSGVGLGRAKLAAVSRAADNAKVRSTLLQLQGALGSDSDCSGYLKSGIAGGSTAVFNAFYGALTGVNGGTPIAGAADFTGTANAGANAVTGDLSTGYQLTINTAGAFFNTGRGVGYSDNPQIQNMQSGTLQAQYFILLHELAHYFQVPQYIQGDGGNNIPAQKSNNDAIWNHCSNTILGAGQGTA